MTVLLIAFAVASLLTLFILHAASVEGHLCLDSDLAGPQKLHARPVPRVGGIGIAFGTLAAVLLMIWQRADVGMPALVLLACAVPAFAAGLLEDLTKRVSPAKRLLCTALAATLAAWLLGAVITRTDIPGLDLVAATPLGAMCLAIFVVSGVSNSINIIDGMNGLASMCSVIMLAGLSYVAFGVGDQLVMLSALAVIGAVLGFFMWNYPRGLIFLGDGGAYFVGFMLAVLGILLVNRNPQVSPIFPLMLCAYPIFETLFSMYRRKVVRGRSVGLPDGIHLHTLIYKRLMRWAIGAADAAVLTRRNSMTSPYLWVLCSLSVVPSVLWWNSSAILAAWLLVFVLSYRLLYSRIVRFKTPRILVVDRRQPGGGTAKTHTER
jgi:UDP-N-acetylmuramyl pentapeptide phosphotransferase/UDP-N-acetylglucosamine-1-phosphate transferase